MKVAISSTVVLIFLLIIFLSVVNKNKEEKGGGEMISEANLTLTTLYDNYEHDPELKTAWGFSCLARDGKTILFDTGGDSETLLYNMEKLGIDAKKIDTIVLSHIHGDHTGGLSGILEINSNVSVYIPKSFPDSFKNDVKSYGAEVVEVSGSTKIYPSVYTTGELGTWIKEQSLITNTDRGLVVITGCSHPRIVNILKKVKEVTGQEIYLVIGGFHLLGASDSELRDIIKSFRELGVEKVAPSHCSGDRARQLFKEEYKDDFIANGVGNVIEI